MMSSLDEVIIEMKRDFIHGSSWYFETIANLLANIGEEEIRVLEKVLPNIRPGIATISNISAILSNKKDSSISEIRKIGTRLLKYRADSSSLLDHECANYEIKSSITISFSNAVASFIDKTGIKHLILLRSSPGEEWRAALKKYSSFCDVNVVPDATMFHFLKEVDSVVIGSDGMFSDGYNLNKIGSYPLCLCAHQLKKRVIVVGESFKASIDKERKTAEKAARTGNNMIKLPIFEKIPLNLVKLLITDQGSFSNPNYTTIRTLHEKFVENVLGD